MAWGVSPIGDAVFVWHVCFADTSLIQYVSVGVATVLTCRRQVDHWFYFIY